MKTRPSPARLAPLLLLVLPIAPCARATTAYGSLNNFDTVNDTGTECHGFEIELEDLHSTEVTYTYDYNHYGTPRITEDSSVPGHPHVFVRYASAKNPDGTWAAYTAVPAAPILPTDGHQFTNPAVNFGGEHFGVGFSAAPTVVHYHWLLDDGTGTLVLGPAVNVATPTFTYLPAGGGQPAQVQAAIVPPPEVPVREFGQASWVKEIRTTTHNPHPMKLRDLVSDDPDSPDDINWRNGEPDEVEAEWQLLQTEFNADDGGANGELDGAPELLEHGDEVVTRRYEFYVYTGPLDPENGEARTDKVAADGIHGMGTKKINGVEVDLSTIEVVGAYIGAQMAAFDAQGELGLIDHLEDGEVDLPYVARTVVIAGNAPFSATTTGALPDGMNFDAVTGVVSGTPTASGTYDLTVSAQDTAGTVVAKTYTITIADTAVVLPPHAAVDTVALPAAGGTTSGAGTYAVGSLVVVTALPSPGFRFVQWTEAGAPVSANASYEFTLEVNHSLVAQFAELLPSLEFAAGAGGTLELSWPVHVPPWALEESADLLPNEWKPYTGPVQTLDGQNHATVNTTPTRNFFRLHRP